MKISLIDIGSNLTHDSFAADRDTVMARAREAGVGHQIVTGADLEGSRQAAALAAAHPGLLSSTAGVHPHHAQRAAFAAQLEIAVAARKPVFLHQRDAHGDFAAMLKEFRRSLQGGVAHCFTGGRSELEDYLALDLYVGVTGWVSDERRGQSLREAVPHIPADRLMVETDAPYLLPRDLVPHPKSRRNEPCYLPHIVRAVADLRGESVDAVASATTSNAIRF